MVRSARSLKDQSVFHEFLCIHYVKFKNIYLTFKEVYLDENRIQELPRGFFRLSNLEKGTLTGLEILFKLLFLIFSKQKFSLNLDLEIKLIK